MSVGERQMHDIHPAPHAIIASARRRIAKHQNLARVDRPWGWFGPSASATSSTAIMSLSIQTSTSKSSAATSSTSAAL
jgi:hypothetical protein